MTSKRKTTAESGKRKQRRHVRPANLGAVAVGPTALSRATIQQCEEEFLEAFGVAARARKDGRTGVDVLGMFVRLAEAADARRRDEDEAREAAGKVLALLERAVSTCEDYRRDRPDGVGGQAAGYMRMLEEVVARLCNTFPPPAEMPRGERASGRAAFVAACEEIQHYFPRGDDGSPRALTAREIAVVWLLVEPPGSRSWSAMATSHTNAVAVIRDEEARIAKLRRQRPS